MSKVFYKFECEGQPDTPEKCTTRWPETISCLIPIDGVIADKYTNIMILDGPDEDILTWVGENTGKISALTIEEANTLGQTIIPPATEMDVSQPGEDPRILVAGTFNIEADPCLVWTEK